MASLILRIRSASAIFCTVTLSGTIVLTFNAVFPKSSAWFFHFFQCSLIGELLNVTVHPPGAGVTIVILLCNCSLLQTFKCSLPIKRFSNVSCAESVYLSTHKHCLIAVFGWLWDRVAIQFLTSC